ncbi:MAG: pyridoxamine 5'-phosphate oxidase family protein [Synergistaceae bacterium]|nr:pyridoxamine 5'-phosphate oxidase family protein [Synergistaceae bacterium]
MRRKEKEVTSREWMMEVLEKGVWMDFAMAGKDGWPYIVPLNYGFKDNFIIIHGAREGKKIDLLRENNKIAFNLSIDTEVVRNKDNPAEFSMKYRSVSGQGVASFIEDLDEKKEALKILMRQYDGPTEPMPEGVLKATAVIKIQITEMTGKISKYPKPE